MIINHKSGKGGAVGKDGTTPHIGANGNWFLGETDTGVAAQGKSDTRIETILLPVADWDSETFSQTITCSGVLEDETKQIITTVALPGNEEICEACHIICSAFAKDSLTFTATVMPEADIYLYVIFENVSGGTNAAMNVYSIEETVVGTWIDGKPLYRRTITGLKTAGGRAQQILNVADFNIDLMINLHSITISETANNSMGDILFDNYSDVGFENSYYYKKSAEVIVCNIASNAGGRHVILTMEYTKTTDTATIEIPTATAMTEAYEEGVNEA